VHQASRLVNDLVLELACHSYLLPGGAPVSFKRRLDGCLPHFFFGGGEPRSSFLTGPGVGFGGGFGAGFGGGDLSLLICQVLTLTCCRAREGGQVLDSANGAGTRRLHWNGPRSEGP
jgi:hypothetical protein